KNGSIKIYSSNINSFNLIKSLYQKNYVISLLRLENENFVSGDFNGSFYVWNYQTCPDLIYRGGNKSSVHVLEYLKNRTFLSGSREGFITAWNIYNGTQIKEFYAGSMVRVIKSLNEMNKIKNVEINSSIPITCISNTSLETVKTIASGLGNGVIKIWDLSSFSLLYNLTGHTSAVQSIEYLPDKYLASGDENGIIIIWNLLNQTKHT
ncbi:unnamed protein product, partial [Brachionus calyciflorus]